MPDLISRIDYNLVHFCNKSINDSSDLELDVEPFDFSALELAALKSKYQSLLFSIADQLGYKFTSDDLNRDYFPYGHQKKSNQEAFIREGLIKLLRDGKPLPLAVKEFPQPDDS